MSDVIEAMARAVCGLDLQWRDCETACMQASACRGIMNPSQLAEARAAAAALFDWLAYQSQDKVVLNWLAAMRKEALSG